MYIMYIWVFHIYFQYIYTYIYIYIDIFFFKFWVRVLVIVSSFKKIFKIYLWYLDKIVDIFGSLDKILGKISGLFLIFEYFQIAFVF